MNSSKITSRSLAISLALTPPLQAAPTVVQQATLPKTSLTLFGNTAAELNAATANGMTRVDMPAIASGLHYLGDHRYLGVTDRGATYQTAGKRILPLPGHNPAIVIFRAAGAQLSIESVLPVTTQSGQKVTGLTTSALDETAFANPADATALAFNPNGLDLEEVVPLPGGRYVAVDEYNPSVVIIESTGKVAARYTPVSKTLAGADYPVKNILPDVYKNRRNSRGFEAVIVSPDGKTAYAFMQSPLGPTTAASPQRLTNVARILRLDVTDPLNATVTGQFVFPMSPASVYPAGNRPQDLKISAATWESPDVFIVLERSDEIGLGGVRLIRCDLKAATNFHGQAFADTLDLEDVTKGPTALNVTPARTEVVFEEFETQYRPARIFSEYKLEGLAFVGRTRLALINDNDFSQGDLAGIPNRLTVLEFGKAVQEAVSEPLSLTHFGNDQGELTVGLANGLARTDMPAIASSLQHVGDNRYLGVMDRGPTFTTNGKRVLPLPNYNPALVFFRAEGERIAVERVVPILTAGGRRVTGQTTAATDETAFANAADATPIPFNPNGLDLEEAHTLPGGGFIAVDEYAPSIVIIGADGRVAKRYTPVSKPLSGADYPVANILPDVFKNRRNSRGFEGLVVSPDGSTAFAVMQSPMGSTAANSPQRLTSVARVLRLDITNPTNAVVTGQFALNMSPAAEYPTNNRPQDLKISAAAWAGDNVLLLLERSDEPGIGGVRLMRCDLNFATNFHGLPVADTLDLEDTTKGLAAFGVSPARMDVVFQEFETQTAPPRLFPEYKLEGLAFLSPTRVAVINDNDFSQTNVQGVPNRLVVLEFGQESPAFIRPAPNGTLPRESAALAWNAALGAEFYYLDVDTIVGGSFGQRLWSGGVFATSVNLPALPAGATIRATLHAKFPFRWADQPTVATFTVAP